jgi:hypothetical protein
MAVKVVIHSSHITYKVAIEWKKLVVWKAIFDQLTTLLASSIN